MSWTWSSNLVVVSSTSQGVKRSNVPVRNAHRFPGVAQSQTTCACVPGSDRKPGNKSMCHPSPVHPATPAASDNSEPINAARDAFSWWEVQVPVMVTGDFVRGWVLTCRHSRVTKFGLATGR
jgi:hypothetical protein